MKKPFIVDVRPVRSENLTPKEYLKIIQSDPTLIDRSQFVPPTPGIQGFGHFFVRYSRTRHKTLAHG